MHIARIACAAAAALLLAPPIAAQRASAAGPAPRAVRPNIVFILADDLGADNLGCYGSPNVRTPNIDRLAGQGLRFARAFASCAMCSPIRASLYTGLYPLHHGVYKNHANTLPGTQSVCHYLQPLGYRVGIAGKTDIRPPAVYPFEPVPGFEPRCTATTADYTLAASRSFMTRDAQQPFCLFICSTLPHAPWSVGDVSHFQPQRLVLPPHWADTPKTRVAYAQYLAEVEVLDRQVGDVLRVVEEAGLGERTLVLFCGEQGPQFPGGKWTCYEHGLHTALLARWPGHVQAGTVSNAIVQVEDILPTLIEIAGGQAPEKLDGRSFLAVLSGARTEHREFAFGIHNNVPEGTPYPVRSIRSERYKLILNLTPQRAYMEKHMMLIDREDYWHSWLTAAETDPRAAQMLRRFVQRPAVELYDVQRDPWELDNLADQPEHQALRGQLEAQLRAWMARQGDTGAALDKE